MRVICLAAAILTITACRPTHRSLTSPGVPAPKPETIAVEEKKPSEPKAGPATLALEPESNKKKPAPLSPRDPGIDLAELNAALRDVLFSYDRSDLSPEALTAIETNARQLAPFLSSVPEMRIIVEGHCDERGSSEYNLALGDRRARRVADALRDLNVPQSKLQILSYGKEMPQCMDSEEACWQRNRRAHLVVRGETVSSRE